MMNTGACSYATEEKDIKTISEQVLEEEMVD